MPSKKKKCARSSESLPTGLLCSQYNPEIRRQIRDTDSGQIPRLLETKNYRELMNKFLLELSAVVAVFLPLSRNAQAKKGRLANAGSREKRWVLTTVPSV
jgi:hypothetical protein